MDASSPHAHDDDFLRLDQQLCFALYSASLAMTQRYKTLLRPLGLTYPQYLVMLVLWERDALAVHELGQRLHLDSGTLTPLLKRMETAGWLKRDRDAEDERRVRVTLTDQGWRLREQARHVPRQLACDLATAGHDIPELRSHLNELRRTLGER
jgi:DNA-binding MarR family transcriptional regulator